MKLLRTAGVVGAAGLLVALSSCASSPESASPSAGSDGDPFRVGVVSDTGGFNDRGFNDLSVDGLELAESEYGVEFESEARESQSEADLVPNLQYFAQQGYDLVIAVGFSQSSAVAEVAPEYPDMNFAIVDVSVSDPALADLDNVSGIVFREQEGAYLAGVLVGELRNAGFEGFDGTAVSTVGGEKQPAVDHFIAGFQDGASTVDPSVELLNGYSQSFSDQNACKELATTQLDSGSDVIFAVAGGCGLGALDAAEEAGAWGIGVDADQSSLGDFILTSVVKRVDSAVAQVIRDSAAGDFQGGEDAVYGIENGGVGLGKIADGVPQEALDAVTTAEEAIKDGSITVRDSLE